MTTIEVVFFLVELAGTVAFAVSGAMTAIQRELDLFGVLFLGVVTAIGGGVIRDLLLGQTPPQAFVNYIYLMTAAVTSFVVFLLELRRVKHEGRSWRYTNGVLNFFDAAGLGMFSVIGVQNTVAAGFGDNAFFCIFLGMTTGVGGGMLRDMMSRETPVIFRKHVYALASIGGSVCYYGTRSLHPFGSVAFSTLLVVAVRLLAAHYRWKLPKIRTPVTK